MSADRVGSPPRFTAQELWENIIELVIRSLVCADDVIPYQPNGFEVFGYDVLIDENMKPWLIEVNSSPSMGTDSELDTRVKHRMIDDAIRLVRCTYFAVFTRPWMGRAYNIRSVYCNQLWFDTDLSRQKRCI